VACANWRRLGGIARANERPSRAQGALRDSRLGLLAAQQDVGSARAGTTAAAARLHAGRERMDAWTRLDAARRVARDETTIGQKLAHLREHNAWRERYRVKYDQSGSELRPFAWEKVRNGGFAEDAEKGFSSPKWWQETGFYDGRKDMLKGVAHAAAKTGVEVAQGKARGKDVWRAALLVGATGAVRGAVNSAANRLFPGGGLQETVWKIGSKSLDDYVRDKIRTATSAPPA
jgi:hypothetical protein